MARYVLMNMHANDKGTAHFFKVKHYNRGIIIAETAED